MSRLGTFTTILVVTALAVLAGKFLSLEGTKELIEQTRDAVADLGIWKYPVWVGLHALAIVVCFPGAIAFEAGAGYLFGLQQGVASVLVAKTVGASICYWLGRTLLRERAEALLQSYPKFQFLSQGVAEDGWWFVILARLSPLPSYLINYGSATLNIRFFPDYICATAAGMLLFAVQNTYTGYLAKQGVNYFSNEGASKGGLLSWGNLSQFLPMLFAFGTVFFIIQRLRAYSQKYQDKLTEGVQRKSTPVEPPQSATVVEDSTRSSPTVTVFPEKRTPRKSSATEKTTPAKGFPETKTSPGQVQESDSSDVEDIAATVKFRQGKVDPQKESSQTETAKASAVEGKSTKRRTRASQVDCVAMHSGLDKAPLSPFTRSQARALRAVAS